MCAAVYLQLAGGLGPIYWLVSSATTTAVACSDDPSTHMRTVGVVGTSGKTTVSWLVRGMLEEIGALTGMVGSIEYALAEDRLTPDGDLWEADEEDPTRKRECSAPFALAPYRGKYWVEDTTPDGLHMQVSQLAPDKACCQLNGDVVVKLVQ